MSPSNDQTVPGWLQQARSHWSHKGAQRPPFAEEPGPSQESVWDYPRPPAIVPDERQVRVGTAGHIVANTEASVRVLETASPPAFYLPPGDVDFTLLRAIDGSSHCEWKGAARYWADAARPSDDTVIAWAYDRPYPEFASIAGWLSFYPGRIECRVDDEVVRPQSGGFYGGWITNDVVGPFKGDPGTGGW